MSCGALNSGVWWPTFIHITLFTEDVIMLVSTCYIMLKFYTVPSRQEETSQHGRASIFTLGSRWVRQLNLTQDSGKFLLHVLRYLFMAVAVESAGFALSWH